MTDTDARLIERLRGNPFVVKNALDAAARIESLTAEVARLREAQQCPTCARLSELLACSVSGCVHYAVEPERSGVEVRFAKRDEAGEMSGILCDLHPLDEEGCFIHGAPLPARAALGDSK